MKAAIIIVNYRTAKQTVDCLHSLARERLAAGPYRVLVVDNASGDDSADRIGSAIEANGWREWVTLLPLTINGGFASGNNAGIRSLQAAGLRPQYVWLLNPDTLVRPGAFAALIHFLDAHPYAGIAGSRLEDATGRVQQSAHRFFSPWSELDTGAKFGPLSRWLAERAVSYPTADLPHTCDWVSGASLMLRWEILETVGLLDEGYFLYFEEVDFCLRARRAGWQVWHVPASQVVHLEGEATGIRRQGRRARWWFESRRRYFLKNYGPRYAALADLARVGGTLLHRARCVLERRPHGDPERFLRDLAAYSVSGGKAFYGESSR